MSLITSCCGFHFNPTADCISPSPPINGSLLQPDPNTTEGSVVVFQCDPGFVPDGEMTAACWRDGQWTPNPGGVTCSPRPSPQYSTQVFISTISAESSKLACLYKIGCHKKEVKHRSVAKCVRWLNLYHSGMTDSLLHVTWLPIILQYCHNFVNTNICTRHSLTYFTIPEV